MRWAWICSRNDAVGNLAVMLAAAGMPADACCRDQCKMRA